MRSRFALVAFVAVVLLLAGGCRWGPQGSGRAPTDDGRTLDRAAAARLLERSLTGGPRYTGQGGKWDSVVWDVAKISLPLEVTGITASDDPFASATATKKATFTVGYETGEKLSGEAYFQMYDDGWRLERAYIPPQVLK